MDLTEQEEQTKAPVVLTPLAPPPPLPTALEAQEKKRPVSVIVIAILFFLGALASIVGLAGSFARHDTLGILVQVSSAIFFNACLVMGIGLLAWRNWARIGAIITIVARYITMLPLTYWQFKILLRMDSISSEKSTIIITSATVTLLFFAVYFGAMIFFLTRPGVKAAFTLK